MSALPFRSTPAKAGAQLRAADCSGVALTNYDLRDWAPACAGVGNLG
ncbi:hypothetical protein AB5I39_15935 [Sphingomonas sp. MMS24-J45]